MRPNTLVRPLSCPAKAQNEQPECKWWLWVYTQALTRRRITWRAFFFFFFCVRPRWCFGKKKWRILSLESISECSSHISHDEGRRKSQEKCQSRLEKTEHSSSRKPQWMQHRIFRGSIWVSSQKMKIRQCFSGMMKSPKPFCLDIYRKKWFKLDRRSFLL